MNDLDQANSHYLRLHKDNPVAWRQWGPEALAEAASSGKPIFLSIGYSACHWCHEMNRDSFSDAETAAYINEHFLPILVDREDRPDVDVIYQAAAQFMNHGGGWPLNIFLTSKAVPYFVCGFLPREERMGQPPFGKILSDVVAIDPEQVTNVSGQVRLRLEAQSYRDMRAAFETIALDAAALRVGQRFDVFLGGLIGPRKFPAVTALEVLWRAYLRNGATQFLLLVTTTLDNLVLGGLYDHVGGGFFRYTHDENWQLPHFEKMLYDNAQVIEFLTGIWQFNRNELVRERVSETITWMLRDLKLGGGFAAGFDGSSDGEEGKYYLWSEAEVDAALAGTFSARFKQVYGVTREGNMVGKNVLRRQTQAPQIADADYALLARQRDLLLAARGKRTAPQRDDKLMTDWNGLAIRALARAGAVFERADWVQAAITAYDYVREVSGEGEILYHNFVDGKHGQKGYSNDYAEMARAALQLWEVTGESRFLDDAKTWTATLDTQFWSEERGGYNYTANDAERLIVRTRTIADQTTPSANGSMLTVLTRLALITGDGAYARRAHGITTAFADEVNRNYIAAGEMLNGLEYYTNALHTVVVGPRSNVRTQELIRAIWGRVLPNNLLVVVESTDELPDGHPAKGKPLHGGQPTVYVCQRNVCSPPVTSAVTLSQSLTLPQASVLQQQRP